MSSPDGIRTLRVRTGLIFAFAWGIAGGVAAILAVAALQAQVRWQDLTMLGEYRSWLHAALSDGLWPAIGCATILACSAWIAYAPCPPRNLASCLIQVTVASLVLWWLAAAAELTPRRFRGVEHPPIYLSEFLVLVIPPVAVTGFLTAAYVHANRTSTVGPK